MAKKGAYKGARLQFLLSQKPAFNKAVNDKNRAEVLADIQRRFFKRFPLDKADDWEPTEEELEAIDDDEPDHEPQEPCKEDMTPEDFEKASEQRKKRMNLLTARRNKIRRWFKYQYDKEHSVSLSLTDNPYYNLILQLFGKESKKPHLKTGVNLGRKVQENHDAIEAEVMAIVPPVDVKDLAKTRDAVARRLFASLDEGVQQQWKEIASEEHSKAMKQYEAELAEGPSLGPEDRQRAIERLTRVMQPILDALCKATGWVATFMAGGPEPARDGSLSILSVHAGVTTGPVKMNFGAAESVRIKEQWIPTFTTFVRKCFTAEMRKAVALPQDKGFVPLNNSPNIDPSLLHVVGETISTVQSSGEFSTTSKVPKPRKKKRRAKKHSSDVWDGLYSFSDQGSDSSEEISLRAPSPDSVRSAPPSPAHSVAGSVSGSLQSPQLPSRNAQNQRECTMPSAPLSSTSVQLPRPQNQPQAIEPTAAISTTTSALQQPQSATQSVASATLTSSSPAKRSSAAALIASVLADSPLSNHPSKTSGGSDGPSPSVAHASPAMTPPVPATSAIVQTAPLFNAIDPALAPRSSHPSVTMPLREPISRDESAQSAGTAVGMQQRGGKRKSIDKVEKSGISKRQKNDSRKSAKQGKSGTIAKDGKPLDKNTTQPTVDPPVENTIKPPADTSDGCRRSTRGVAAANNTSRPTPVHAAEGTVVLRTGKVAKKSKFWTYEEIDVEPSGDNQNK